METLNVLERNKRIPMSALLIAVFLLSGITVAAVIRVFGGQPFIQKMPDSYPLGAAFYAANFGRFGPQQHPTVRFILTNRTTERVTIEHVIPSCGCITANCSPRDVAPSAATTITITYRGFPGVFGPFGKSVAVIYQEAPTGPQKGLRLFVRGDAVSDSPLRVYPQSVYLENVAPGSKVTSYLYFHGWRSLLQSLPAVVHLFPGNRGQLIVRQVGHSRATRDKAIQLIWRVPMSQSKGKFKFPLLFTGSAIGTMLIEVTGRISNRVPTVSAASKSFGLDK